MTAVPLTEKEQQAMAEVAQLVKEGKLAEAVQKVCETFHDEQGLSLAIREVVAIAVLNGFNLGEAFERVGRAVQQVNDEQKRQVLVGALERHRQKIEEFKEALRRVAGIWADHPEFEEVGGDVREWRKRAWGITDE